MNIITAAAALAPSVHNTRPWLLEFDDDHVSLYERLDRSCCSASATRTTIREERRP
jgi:hypothetical protein